MTSETQWLEIGGALGRFWSGGSGPSHAAITGALMAAGYEEPESGANKQTRVLDAFRSADHPTRERLLDELLIVLRGAGLLDGEAAPVAEQLERALARSGRSLSADGFADSSRIESPGGGAGRPALHEPATGAAAAMSREDQDGSAVRKGVFISHATADREIARTLIGLLTSTVPGAQQRIFCTSVEGYEIAPGRNWLENIRAQLEQSALTVFVVTPQFLGRQFCQFELGAVWAASDEPSRFPLLLPPVEHAEIGPILSSWQAPSVSERALELLVERAAQQLGLEVPRATQVGPAVREALTQVERILEPTAAVAGAPRRRSEPYACTVQTTSETIRQVDVTYPIVTFTGGPRAESLTRLFEAEVSAGVNAFVAQWADRPFTLNDDETHHPSFGIDAEITFVSPDLLSAVLTTVYFTGGANAMQQVATLNLDPHSGGHLGLGDLLGLGASDLDRFVATLTIDLQHRTDHTSAHPGRPFRTESGLGFAFDKYEVGPGSAGPLRIEYSQAELVDLAHEVNVQLTLP